MGTIVTTDGKAVTKDNRFPVSAKSELVDANGNGIDVTEGLTTDDVNARALNKILKTLEKIEFHLSTITDNQL